jgi:hypothetical protein
MLGFDARVQQRIFGQSLLCLRQPRPSIAPNRLRAGGRFGVELAAGLPQPRLAVDRDRLPLGSALGPKLPARVAQPRAPLTGIGQLDRQLITAARPNRSSSSRSTASASASLSWAISSTLRSARSPALAGTFAPSTAITPTDTTPARAQGPTPLRTAHPAHPGGTPASARSSRAPGWPRSPGTPRPPPSAAQFTRDERSPVARRATAPASSPDRAPPGPARPADRRHRTRPIHLRHSIKHKPRQMPLRQPLPQARRHQQRLLAITPQEVLRHARNRLNRPGQLWVEECWLRCLLGRESRVG